MGPRGFSLCEQVSEYSERLPHGATAAPCVRRGKKPPIANNVVARYIGEIAASIPAFVQKDIADKDKELKDLQRSSDELQRNLAQTKKDLERLNSERARLENGLVEGSNLLTQQQSTADRMVDVINLKKQEIAELNKQYDLKKNEINQMATQMEGLENESRSVEAKQTEMFANFQKTNQALEEAAAKLMAKKIEFNSCSNMVADMQKEIRTNEFELSQLTNKKSQLIVEMTSIEASLAKKKQELSENEEKLARFAENVTKEKEEEVKTLREAITKKKDEMADTEEGLAKKKEEMTGIEEAITKKKEEMAGMEEDLAEKKEEMTGIEEAIIKKKEEMAGMDETLAKKREELADTERALVEKNNEIETVEQALNNKRNEVALAQKELEDIIAKKQTEKIFVQKDLDDLERSVAQKREELAVTQKELKKNEWRITMIEDMQYDYARQADKLIETQRQLELCQQELKKGDIEFVKKLQQELDEAKQKLATLGQHTGIEKNGKLHMDAYVSMLGEHIDMLAILLRSHDSFEVALGIKDAFDIAKNKIKELEDKLVLEAKRELVNVGSVECGNDEDAQSDWFDSFLESSSDEDEYNALIESVKEKETRLVEARESNKESETRQNTEKQIGEVETRLAQVNAEYEKATKALEEQKTELANVRATFIEEQTRYANEIAGMKRKRDECLQEDPKEKCVDEETSAKRKCVRRPNSTCWNTTGKSNVRSDFHFPVDATFADCWKYWWKGTNLDPPFNQIKVSDLVFQYPDKTTAAERRAVECLKSTRFVMKWITEQCQKRNEWYGAATSANVLTDILSQLWIKTNRKTYMSLSIHYIRDKIKRKNV